ncbi:MAG: hypothetical protein LBU48_07685 [Coriobacteriales bacterium]|nr:hypothetical protein [Coriobacteriales bacterium]
MTAITLRWRIHEGQITLRQRHLNALAPLDLPAPLMGWIHERLEWAALNLLDQCSEGVLVLNIDPATEVVVSLEPLRETPQLTLDNLLVVDGVITGAHIDGEQLEGVIFIEQSGVVQASATRLVTAASTLARDLLTTLGYAVELQPVDATDFSVSSVLLISDEFGAVPLNLTNAADESAAVNRLRACFEKVF